MTLQQIADIVCEYKGVTLGDLTTKSRKPNVVYARFLISYFARKDGSIYLVDIGELLGSRHHTTIMNGVDKIKDFLFIKDETVTVDVANITQRLDNIDNHPTGEVIKKVSFWLDKMPQYSITPCSTFGELAEQLNKRIA